MRTDFLELIILSLFSLKSISNITEGIYLIKFKNNYISFGKDSTIFFTQNNIYTSSEKKPLFMIQKYSNTNINEQLNEYFYIMEKKSYLYLTLCENSNEIKFSFRINDANISISLWEIVPHMNRKNNNKLYYYIKNKFYDKYLGIENIIQKFIL